MRARYEEKGGVTVLQEVKPMPPTRNEGSVAKFDFWGKSQKSGTRNSTIYRLPNSRKSNFATEPLRAHDALPLPNLPMQPPLDFGTVGRIAIGAEDEADVPDRGTRRRLRPGKGVDVFPHEVTRRRHFEYPAPNPFANERVARPQPLTAGDKKAVEGVAGIALIFP